jgi:hypothetical protein
MSPQGDGLTGFLQIVRTEMKNTGFEPVTSTSPWRFFRGFQCFPTSQVIDRHPLEPIKPLKVDAHGVIRFLSEDEAYRVTRRGGITPRRARCLWHRAVAAHGAKPCSR